MAILSPSGLETIVYQQSGWHSIVTSNMQRLNDTLLKLSALGDVDVTGLADGDVLAWNNTSSRWEVRSGVGLLHKTDATTDPTVNDDSGDGNGK